MPLIRPGMLTEQSTLTGVTYMALILAAGAAAYGFDVVGYIARASTAAAAVFQLAGVLAAGAASMKIALPDAGAGPGTAVTVNVSATKLPDGQGSPPAPPAGAGL